MYCPHCGAQNETTNRFCVSCGKALDAPATGVATSTPGGTLVAAPAPANVSLAEQSMPNPVVIAPPKPSNPVAVAAPLGGLAGILCGAASAIGWFMPWFGLGQLGAGLGGLLGGATNLLGVGGGVGSILGGGIGGSGFQLMMLAIQVPSLVNSFGGLYGARSTDATGITLIAILVILLLLLIPIMGLLNIRSGALALQGRSSTSATGVRLVQAQLDAIRFYSTVGFVLMVIIFILLAQIPFATTLLSSGFFITIGGFALAWFLAMLAKGQVRPGPYRLEGDE